MQSADQRPKVSAILSDTKWSSSDGQLVNLLAVVTSYFNTLTLHPEGMRRFKEEIIYLQNRQMKKINVHLGHYFL